MNRMLRIRMLASVFIPAILLSSCNLQGAGPAATSATAAPEKETAAPVPTNTETTAPRTTLTGAACQTSEDGALNLCFLDISDGQTIAANPDGPISISAEASGATVTGITLSADPGDYAKYVENSGGSDPFRADFSWTPALGAGTYRLKLEAMNGDKSETAIISLSVTVTGLSAISPTLTLAPGEVPSEIRTQVLETYRTTFGIHLTEPVIARKFRSGVDDPWVSPAYIGNTFYEVDIFPDGRVEAWTTPLFPNTNVDIKNSLFKDPLCRPAGVYSMLVIFLDFGNLSVGKDEVLADLEAATTAVNADYAAYPSAGPGSAPILHINTTGVFIPVPAGVAGFLMKPDKVQQYTGVDPSNYTWIAQVDLDANSTLRFSSGGPDNTSFGYSFSGCPPTKTILNIQITIDAKEELTGSGNRLWDTMLAHEVFHLFGYPGSHIWPCISGPQKDASDSCGNGAYIPALMLGWVDVDGDQVPEILDTTPYGILSS
jgi:hypothetical protein